MHASSSVSRRFHRLHRPLPCRRETLPMREPGNSRSVAKRLPTQARAKPDASVSRTTQSARSFNRRWKKKSVGVSDWPILECVR